MTIKRKDKLKFEGGEHLVMCDVCGFVVKASETTRRWDGLLVCPEDNEERPVFRNISKTEGNTVSDRQPEPSDIFVSDDTLWGDTNLFWETIGSDWEDDKMDWS